MLDIGNVSLVNIIRWRLGSWRFSSRRICRRSPQVPYMVDDLYVIFVIALEAGLFVLPCSGHVVSLFSAQVLDQVRAWVQQRWRHEVLQCARQLQELTEQESSKRQSGTPCSCSGSFCCRLRLFSPNCRTPSGGGGRSPVSRSPPEPTQSRSGSFCRPGLPGEGVGPNERRKTEKPYVHVPLKSAFFFSFADCIVGAWLKTAGSSTSSCAASTRVLARMSSTAPVQKVGQALAKDLWKEHREEHEA